MTVAAARQRGARGIDFAFDSNWGYLQVTDLCAEPLSCERRVVDAECGVPKERPRTQIASGRVDTVRVRVKEMSLGHKGLAVSRKALAKFAAKCPALRDVSEETWAAVDGPLVKLPLEVLRVLLHWAANGVLLYACKQTKAVHAALKAAGALEAARGVKRLEAKELRRLASEAKAKASSSCSMSAARGRQAVGKATVSKIARRQPMAAKLPLRRVKRLSLKSKCAKASSLRRHGGGKQAVAARRRTK